MTPLPAGEALRLLLRRMGRTCAPGELRDITRNWSPESMSEELRDRGFEARPVQLSAGDLVHLDLPTLVQCADGGWLLLAARKGDQWIVHDGGETQLFDERALTDRLSGLCLEVVPRVGQGGLERRLLAALLRHKRSLAEIAAASLLLQLLSLLPPQLTRVTMDKAFPEGAGALLNLVAFGLVFAAGFRAWNGWIRQKTILHLRGRVGVLIDRDFMSHVLALPFALLHRRTIGEFLQSVSGLGASRELVLERGLGVLLDAVMAVTYLAAMAALAVGPTLAVVVCVTLIAAWAAAVAMMQAQLQKREIEAQVEERGALVEMLRGVATVKAAGAEQDATHRWLTRLGREFAIALGRLRLGLWSELGMDVVRQALTVGLFAWGAKLVLARQLGVGEFFALVQMTGGFMGAMLGFTGTLLAAVLMRPQLTVARALLAAPAEPAPSRQGVRTLTGPVVLENVWFRYDDDAPWVLRDFDLRVEAGEKRWLKAPSGFGKSTILRLMSGLLSPQQGQIRIAGQSPRSVRDLVLYLPQSVHLFGGSIYENLRLLSIDAPRERLLEAAQASGLHAFVSTLPMTYETVLPPGGGSLSGGQRQLIALTAMMASDRPLLLLDEALANLDWISRSWISRSSWFDYKTVVYASHDARIGLDESGATDLALAAQARRERQER